MKKSIVSLVRPALVVCATARTKEKFADFNGAKIGGKDAGASHFLMIEKFSEFNHKIRSFIATKKTL